MVYISNNHFQNVAQAKQWRKKNVLGNMLSNYTKKIIISL